MKFLDTSRVRTRFDRRVPAHDGTELSVDLYLPPESGAYPILLTRTAADNNRSGRVLPGTTTMLPAPADRWKALAAQGFIVAAADVRGRGDSDGAFTPFAHEAADGAATIAWLRGHEECNGRMGLFGSGYAAFCAWAAVATGAPVDAIASVSPFGAVGESLVQRNGVLQLGVLFWLHLVGGHALQPANVPRWSEIHRQLPLRDLDQALGRSDTAWSEWLAHMDAADPYWSPLAILDAIAQHPVPGLHVTGWWDEQLGAARAYHDAASSSGAPQRLIIGPWTTPACRRPTAQVGGFDFGPRSLVDLDETLGDFFRSRLIDEQPDASAAARIFVTGLNEWQEADEWPVGDSHRELSPSSRYGANTRRGDGVLGAGGGEGQAADCIAHNPERPVEFQPMFVSFAAGANPLGFTLDQAHITARDEALCYTAAPAEHDSLICGRPQLSLTVQTDGEDADLFVLLSDVFPFVRRELHLTHGAVRLGSLPGFVPGEPLRVEISFGDVGHLLLAGHSLRLSVTPSLFPLYAANPQSVGYLDAAQARVAEIRILHEPAAVLNLPIGSCA